ncbi:unnamed protein product [Alopecurus aequalis]
MGDGRRRRRRRKNARRRAALAAKIDAVPDELFELVFLRLPLAVNLVRAACTCKRWRRIIAADDGRLIRSLHGALDFLPRPESSDFCWELADIRGGLLLLIEVSDCPIFSRPSRSRRPLASPLRLVVCDPLARCYRVIPLPAWFPGGSCLGAFLRDGEDAEAPRTCSLSNFRVTCVLLVDDCVANACVFSSAASSDRWTSDYTVPDGADISFAGRADDGSIAYWTMEGAPNLLSLDIEAGKLSSSFVADKEQYDALRHKCHPQVQP